MAARLCEWVELTALFIKTGRPCRPSSAASSPWVQGARKYLITGLLCPVPPPQSVRGDEPEVLEIVASVLTPSLPFPLGRLRFPIALRCEFRAGRI